MGRRGWRLPGYPTVRTDIVRTQTRAARQVESPLCCVCADQISVAVPPAAVIFSLALAEKACTLTWTATFSSPEPRILTG